MHSCLCGAWSVNRQRVSVDELLIMTPFIRWHFPEHLKKNSRAPIHTSMPIGYDRVKQRCFRYHLPKTVSFLPLCFDPHSISSHTDTPESTPESTPHLRAEIGSNMTSGALEHLSQHLLNAEWKLTDFKWSLYVNLILPFSSFQWLPVALRVQIKILNIICLI